VVTPSSNLTKLCYQLLKNMCNGALQITSDALYLMSMKGMQGKNTETLTYRGPDQAERDQTRIDAGCVDGFCAKQIALGLVPANFRSCDEVCNFFL
jgi:hypothetical protein